MTLIDTLSLPENPRAAQLRDALARRILVLDGSMGSQLAALGLTAADFGGPRQEGCFDALPARRPDVVRNIHERYLEAGADIIETCSFGALRHVLAEYGLQERTRELNFAAAELAVAAARKHASPGQPRFVAGSLGPGTKTITLTGGISFAQVAAAHAEAARGLLEGGVDLLLLETQQDTVNMKASLCGLADCFSALGRRVPVILSASIEASGTTLGGQTAEALADSVAHWGLAGLGLNCALGPELMADHVRTLSALVPGAVICYPNAGLPDEEGRYGEGPEAFAEKLARYCREGWLNIVGGCCGTTPEHIAAVARMAARFAPRRAAPARRSSVCGLESLTVDEEKRPVLVGERANVVGSRLFKEMVAREDFAAAAEVGRRQVRGGAQILDVCLANPDRDETADMIRLLERLAPSVRVPLMIDSTDAAVLEAALQRCPGKCLINSINLEGGEARFSAVAKLAHRYGAALVVGTIDEDKAAGMALTRQRKLAIAQRSHELLTGKYGLPEEDLYFDCLVFPAASGDAKYQGSAGETVAALRLIKNELPNSKTVLGVSNVSFGLPQAGREVLNAVFLHRCVQAGLDLAIVNTEKLARFSEIPAEERRLAEALLDGADPAAFAAHFRQAKPKPAVAVQALPPQERVRQAVLTASREGLEAALAELLKDTPPLAIINGPLMSGMAEVGRLFAEGQLIVAEVLQCAEVMKSAVGLLEPHLTGSRAASRGTIALATVKGDVHDIGKNLVHIILKNNGYEVVDLGIKASSENILAGLRRCGAQALGLSGLLVRSCQEMATAAEDLAAAGVAVPIVAGGAALSARFVAQKIAPRAAGPVLYAKDAMSGLAIFNSLFDPQARESALARNQQEQERLRAAPAAGACATAAPAAAAIRHGGNIPAPPDLELHEVEDLDPEEVFRALDLQMLLGKHLGLKGAVQRLLDARDPKALDLQARVSQLWSQARAQGLLKPRGAYRFCACQAEGDALILYPSAQGGQPLARFDLPRQPGGERLCLADFAAPKSGGRMDYLALFVVSAGAGVREEAARLREAGDYLKSHALSALALEGAEASAQVLHDRLRQLWGIGASGERFSFGYPACPALEHQARLLELLDSRRTAGVSLTEGLMMDPEASVSALVFHHSQARIFAVAPAA